MSEMVAAIRGRGGSRSSGPRTGLKCFNCGAPGHFRRDCPQARQTGRGRGSGRGGFRSSGQWPRNSRGMFGPFRGSGMRGRGRGFGYGSTYPRGQFAIDQHVSEEPQLYTYEDGVTYDEDGYDVTDYTSYLGNY